MTPEEQAKADQEAADKAAADEAVKAAEQAHADEVAAELAFNAGFEGTEARIVDLTPEELKAKEDEAKAEADAKAAEEALAAKTAEEDAKKAELAKPLTANDQQFLDLVKKAQSIDDMNAVIQQVRDRTSGRLGSIEQTLKTLQEATPIGQSVEVTEADFAELFKDLPDIAPGVVTGLKRVLGKMKGTAAPTPVETPEQFEARVNEVADKRIAAALDKKEKKSAMDELARKHADWNTVIGPANSTTEFRTWLKTQPHEYAVTFLASWDPTVVAEGLDRFKESKKPKPAPVIVVKAKGEEKPQPHVARAQRLAEAVPARGGAAAPAKAGRKTAEEELEEGFKS